VYPKDPIARNNLASLGVLLGEDTGQASKLAEEVYSEEPSVSAFAATYAFSLMRAHQPEKALQVLQKLPQTAMADASIGLCYGLALAATGQKDCWLLFGGGQYAMNERWCEPAAERFS
jgi:Flp pilus assembly protein TadD